ncbi:MAG: GatB/YqeY domain-containing protein [Deltaproteobacteria bacterium]|nr:GatB/YqeY domain-containing protein [Deltaproteobacteria bacterium]
MSTLKARIEEDIKQAMRGREAAKLSCLRMVKSALKNKEIDTRAELDDTQIISILSTLCKQRKESIEQFKKGGRDDLVKQEESELALIETYLPKAMDESELIKLIEAAIAETGAAGPKDMGKVMKALTPKTTGRADGKLVSELVRKKLG